MAVQMIIALAIAVISGLGVGGGGLFAVWLAVCTDTPQLSVQGYNLLFFLFCALSSVTVQIFRKKIYFGAVALMAATGLIGALGGSILATVLPEELLRRIFGVMLVSGGIVALRRSTGKK